MPLPKKGARRCIDTSKDINWHGNADDLWNKFKEKYPQYSGKDNKELKANVDDFFKYCGKVLVNTEDGIFLERIGYLSQTVFNDPKNVVLLKHRGNQLINNFRSDGNIYRCYFYPIRWHLTPFKGFMFTINKGLKKILKENIHKGMKYKNHIRILDKNAKVIK